MDLPADLYFYTFHEYQYFLWTMCAGKHLLITLHVYVLLCRAHLYFYKRRL